MNPFSDQPTHQIEDWGERHLIQKIAEWLGNCSRPSPAGIGDDAAVTDWPYGNQVVAKDALVFNKHFDSTTNPESAGAKLVKRNLSDFAAMGATPIHSVVACLLPPAISKEWLERFYSGMREISSTFGLSVIGGDITSTFHDLAFTLTLVGTAKGKTLTRKTCEPGDTLWVTGSLGGSLLGKHLEFSPRLKEGQWLAEYSGISSALDLSDGLATDLLNLLPKHCTSELNIDSLPLSPACFKMANTTGRNPVDHALTDGEDYELLFTLSSPHTPNEFLADWKQRFDTPVSCIGKIDTRIGNDQEPIKYSGTFKGTGMPGYEHF